MINDYFSYILVGLLLLAIISMKLLIDYFDAKHAAKHKALLAKAEYEADLLKDSRKERPVILTSNTSLGRQRKYRPTTSHNTNHVSIIDYSPSVSSSSSSCSSSSSSSSDSGSSGSDCF